jgi:hypothetical protein
MNVDVNVNANLDAGIKLVREIVRRAEGMEAGSSDAVGFIFR